MEKFKELSFEEMQDTNGGLGSSSDFWADVGNAIGKFWCDLKNAAYDYPIRTVKHDWPDSIGKVE